VVYKSFLALGMAGALLAFVPIAVASSVRLLSNNAVGDAVVSPLHSDQSKLPKFEMAGNLDSLASANRMSILDLRSSLVESRNQIQSRAGKNWFSAYGWGFELSERRERVLLGNAFGSQCSPSNPDPSPSVVPEPSTAVLLGLGVAAVLGGIVLRNRAHIVN
jgi:PEP-CTERM motif